MFIKVGKGCFKVMPRGFGPTSKPIYEKCGDGSKGTIILQISTTDWDNTKRDTERIFIAEGSFS